MEIKSYSDSDSLRLLIQGAHEAGSRIRLGQKHGTVEIFQSHEADRAFGRGDSQSISAKEVDSQLLREQEHLLERLKDLTLEEKSKLSQSEPLQLRDKKIVVSLQSEQRDRALASQVQILSRLREDLPHMALEASRNGQTTLSMHLQRLERALADPNIPLQARLAHVCKSLHHEIDQIRSVSVDSSHEKVDSFCDWIATIGSDLHYHIGWADEQQASSIDAKLLHPKDPTAIRTFFLKVFQPVANLLNSFAPHAQVTQKLFAIVQALNNSDLNTEKLDETKEQLISLQKETLKAFKNSPFIGSVQSAFTEISKANPSGYLEQLKYGLVQAQDILRVHQQAHLAEALTSAIAELEQSRGELGKLRECFDELQFVLPEIQKASRNFGLVPGRVDQPLLEAQRNAIHALLDGFTKSVKPWTVSPLEIAAIQARLADFKRAVKVQDAPQAESLEKTIQRQGEGISEFHDTSLELLGVLKNQFIAQKLSLAEASDLQLMTLESALHALNSRIQDPALMAHIQGLLDANPTIANVFSENLQSINTLISDVLKNSGVTGYEMRSRGDYSALQSDFVNLAADLKMSFSLGNPSQVEPINPMVQPSESLDDEVGSFDFQVDFITETMTPPSEGESADGDDNIDYLPTRRQASGGMVESQIQDIEKKIRGAAPQASYDPIIPSAIASEVKPIQDTLFTTPTPESLQYGLEAKPSPSPSPALINLQQDLAEMQAALNASILLTTTDSGAGSRARSAELLDEINQAIDRSQKRHADGLSDRADESDWMVQLNIAKSDLEWTLFYSGLNASVVRTALAFARGNDGVNVLNKNSLASNDDVNQAIHSQQALIRSVLSTYKDRLDRPLVSMTIAELEKVARVQSLNTRLRGLERLSGALEMTEAPLQQDMDIRTAEELARYALENLSSGQVISENLSDLSREATLVLFALRDSLDATRLTDSAIVNEGLQSLFALEAELTQLLQLSESDLALEQWAQRHARESENSQLLLSEANAFELKKALTNHITRLRSSQASDTSQKTGNETDYSQVWDQVISKRIGVLQQVVEEVNYFEKV